MLAGARLTIASAGCSRVTSTPESSVTVMGPAAAAADGELEAAVSSPEPQALRAAAPTVSTATSRSAAVRRPKRMVVMTVVTPFDP